MHEQYGKKITDAGLKQTILGARWFAAAARALQQPAGITLPYREAGYFSAANPSATGLQFTAKKGQKLILQLDKKTASGCTLYLEIWKQNGTHPSLLLSFDTAQKQFEWEVESSAGYILRLQPELLGSCEYHLSISVGPSLDFPVAGKAARIGSIWGDPRDAGVRKHEGIDIFAARGTPAVAAAAGTITSVQETTIGGRVVWLHPSGKDYTLYYAHLDEQLVSPGQSVQPGDTVGRVGNTGNARTTPAHLHFGIYGPGGAVDPLPFVQPEIKKPLSLPKEPDFLTPVHLLAPVTTGTGKTFRLQTVAFPVALTPKGYRVQFPDSSLYEVETGRQAQTILRRGSTTREARLLEGPSATAPQKRSLPAGSSVVLYGFYEDFAYVMTGEENGWVLQSDLR